MNLTLTVVKAEHRYNVTEAPPVQHPYRSFAIRPDRIVIYSKEGGDVIAVVEGRRWLRNGTLGADSSVAFSSLDSRLGRQIPDWITQVVLDAGLSWEKSEARR